MNKAVADQLVRARTALILDHPFFGNLVLRLKLVEETSIPTLAVDGKNIFYNPQFVAELSPELTESAMVHEIGHCIFEHISRREGRDPFIWNCAGDYVINAMIEDAGFKIGKNWLHDPKFAGLSTDTIYELLPKNDSSRPSPGQKGGSLDEIMDGDPASTQVDALEWKIATIQAAVLAKAAGKLPRSIARFVEELTTPKIDWRSVLRRFVTETSKNDYTWMRPNRRYAAQNIYLPTLHSESMGSIAIVVDTSGSIDQTTLAAFATEIKAIVDTTRPEKTTVIYCDATVNHVDEFGPNDQMHFDMHGGGGTDFAPPFEWLAERGENPVCLIYLTDMCGSFPTEPEYPVLWCATSDEVGPFGDTVKIDL